MPKTNVICQSIVPANQNTAHEMYSNVTLKNAIVARRIVIKAIVDRIPISVVFYGSDGENSEPCYAEMNVQGKRVGRECPITAVAMVFAIAKAIATAIGFTGPTCKMPGPGGSIDSGPATNPNSHEAFQRFMYIFFLAVLPIMAAFCFFMYYCRHHPLFAGGKLAENMYVSNNKTGLSFSTSSYTTVTPNICHNLHSPTSSTTYSTSRSSSSTSSTFKCTSSLTPKTSVKIKPPTLTKTATTTSTTTNTKTPASKDLDNSAKLNIIKTLPLNIKTTATSCTSTPKLSTRKSNKLHSSASNENFSKFNIQKQINLNLSKSHNEIATNAIKPITANITKPHIKTKIAIIKPPPPPRSANNSSAKTKTTTTTSASTDTATPTTATTTSTTNTTNNNFNNNSIKLAVIIKLIRLIIVSHDDVKVNSKANHLPNLNTNTNSS
ncbi:hypothetical protein EVAR_70906_1 [Eumeta japonica]|uniref:Uncharacterized protein n=1 Tax=Eumeta variegata TaxID=151549 RepID=A0A4C1SL43_EUMVA|nr:hypothetical protein EVAR_70906_1 [Eumeta japonica]